MQFPVRFPGAPAAAVFLLRSRRKCVIVRIARGIIPAQHIETREALQ